MCTILNFLNLPKKSPRSVVLEDQFNARFCLPSMLFQSVILGKKFSVRFSIAKNVISIGDSWGNNSVQVFSCSSFNRCPDAEKQTRTRERRSKKKTPNLNKSTNDFNPFGRSFTYSIYLNVVLYPFCFYVLIIRRGKKFRNVFTA